MVTMIRSAIRQHLEQAFDQRQATVLAEVIEAAYTNLVKISDFSELKAIVGDLAQAQARTEQRMEELAQAQARTEQRMEELAQAQARTEQRMEELAQAQARTEQRLEELAQAQARTEQRVEELAQAQNRTEQRVEELAQAQARTEGRVGRLEAVVEKLAEAQARTEGRVGRLEAVVEKLAEAQARTQEELRALTQVVGKLSDTQAAMKGDLLEMRYRERAAAYLGKILRRVKVLDTAALEAEFETRLPEAGYFDLLLADAVVSGQLRHPPETRLWLVMEVSAVIDRSDVERAVRRAGYVRQATGAAAALVAGEDITQGAAALAREQHVAVLLDGGQLDNWDEALAHASSH